MNLINNYMFLMDEYKKITDIKEMKTKKMSNTGQSYTALVLRLILLRKFMQTDEKVYILKILKELENEKYDLESKDINKIKKEISDLFSIEITNILPNGKEQRLYHTITDLLYGLYLHSDSEKITNSNLNNEQFKQQLLFEFVSKFEPIVYKIYNFINDNLEVERYQTVNEIAQIISYRKKGKSRKNIKKSKHWSNVHGNDINDYKIEEYINSLDITEQKIVAIVQSFRNLIIQEDLDNIKIFKTLTVGSPIRNHIKDNSDFFKKNANLAMTLTIRYSINMKYAYVNLIPKVDNAFEITDKQMLPGTYTIELKKGFLTGIYKLNKFVDGVPNVYLTMNKKTDHL